MACSSPLPQVQVATLVSGPQGLLMRVELPPTPEQEDYLGLDPANPQFVLLREAVSVLGARVMERSGANFVGIKRNERMEEFNCLSSPPSLSWNPSLSGRFFLHRLECHSCLVFSVVNKQ